MKLERVVTCTAPVNIAVIKYWGKRNEPLILPTNSSLSGTLNQKDLKTITTAAGFKNENNTTGEVELILYLNGKLDANSQENQRLKNVLREMTKAASSQQSQFNTIIVVSENNFPTAAGLASSASGYCCLVYTLAKLYQLDWSNEQLSIIARQGSGSACRSMFGNWCKWEMGQLEDGSDSKAVPCVSGKSDAFAQEMEILICVVSDQKKHTASTDGMRNSIKTSSLMKERIEKVVPERMIQMEEAIANADYQTFSELCMKDSNDFHAVCRDTTPPIHYLNETSFAIMDLVDFYNKVLCKGQNGVAYTYDAGPNAVLYIHGKEHKQKFAKLLQQVFEISGNTTLEPIDLNEEWKIKATELKEKKHNQLKNWIETTLGAGPQIVSTDLSDQTNHLIHLQTFVPK